MPEMDVAFLTIAELNRLYRQRELSPVEVTKALLARIAAHDGNLHSFLRLTEDVALREAEAAERELMVGQVRGPLHGIPYALKDIVETAGILTTGHSKLRQDHVPSEDAELLKRLKAGGGILMGKLATWEFALGGPSFDLLWPPARNPWNPDHLPGGSSSGAGAAARCRAGGRCGGRGVARSRGRDRAGEIVEPARLHRLQDNDLLGRIVRDPRARSAHPAAGFRAHSAQPGASGRADPRRGLSRSAALAYGLGAGAGARVATHRCVCHRGIAQRRRPRRPERPGPAGQRAEHHDAVQRRRIAGDRDPLRVQQGGGAAIVVADRRGAVRRGNGAAHRACLSAGDRLA